MFTRPPYHRGFAPLLIAMGIVAMLGALSLSLQLMQMLVQKRKIARLDNIDGFYAGEMIAWHARERTEASLPSGDWVKVVPAPLQGVGGSVGVGRGISVPFEITSGLVPAHTFFRRISDGGLTWKVPSGADPLCGRAEFGNRSRRRVCLAKNGSTYEFLVFRSESRPFPSPPMQYLLAFDRNGQPVRSFGKNGQVDLEDLPTGYHYTYGGVGVGAMPKMPVLSDGRFSLLRGISQNDPKTLYISRYFETGAADTSFGADGHITVPYTERSNESNWAAYDKCWIAFPDGALVFCATAPEDKTLQFVKYLSNGLPDPSFDGDGRMALFLGDNVSFGMLKAIYSDSQGRIYGFARVQKQNSVNTVVYRLNPDGSLDTNFDQDGIYIAADDCDPIAGMVDANDGFTWVEGGPFGVRFVRIRSQGDLDPDFNGGSPLRLELGEVRRFPLPYSLFVNGGLLSWPLPELNSWTVVLRRFSLVDGKYDRLFGKEGALVLDEEDFARSINGLLEYKGWVLDRHGGFIAIYIYTHDEQPDSATNQVTKKALVRLTRYDSSGKLVTTFGQSGILELHGTGKTGSLGGEDATVLFHPSS